MARKAQQPTPGPSSDARAERDPAAVGSETTAETEVSHDAIAVRAHEIHLSGQGGSDVDDWLRAERELRES